MSQINNITYLNRIRPTKWKDGEQAKYLTDIEQFIRQVYDRLVGVNRVKVYTVANLPDAASFLPNSTEGAAMVFVSDEAGGATIAFSDGTDWRRVQDRVVCTS